MTTLTEQWKRGELPDGEYWCLSICGDVDKLYCYQNSFWKYKTEDDYYGLPVEIKQVLAPMPSYEEVVILKDCLKMVWEAAEREVKLKKLLKECKERLIYCTISTQDIQAKINQMLGENL